MLLRKMINKLRSSLVFITFSLSGLLEIYDEQYEIFILMLRCKKLAHWNVSGNHSAWLSSAFLKIVMLNVLNKELFDTIRQKRLIPRISNKNDNTKNTWVRCDTLFPFSPSISSFCCPLCFNDVTNSQRVRQTNGRKKPKRMRLMRMKTEKKLY